MKNFIPVLIATISLSVLSVFAAERTLSSMTTTTSGHICIDIQKSPLRYKKSDDMMLIQKFLKSKGLFEGETTGYFGSLTNKAIKAYQVQSSLSSTGTVGPLTRAVLKKDTCSKVIIKDDMHQSQVKEIEKQSTTTMPTVPIVASSSIPKVSTTTSVVPLNPSNGVCGSSSGMYTKVIPTTNLCTSGTASAVSGVGPYNWTCNGIDGGLFASCVAPLATSYSPVSSLVALSLSSISGQVSASSARPTTGVITTGAITTVKQKGTRTLGINPTQGALGYDNAFTATRMTGAQVVEVPISWDEVEATPNTYASQWLPIVNAYFPAQGTKVSFSFNVIDSNNIRIPADLKGKAFNDPEVIKRYKAFIDYVASSTPATDVFSVSIGNEVDITLGASDTKWKEFTDFYAAVAPYVKQKFPSAVVGSKVTFTGIFDLDQYARALNAKTDVVMTTYYPFVAGKFTMRSPSDVALDFKKITTSYPNKKIHFNEIGYPSGLLNNSSEAKQSDFIKQTFLAWDTYSDKIAFLNFQWLHDLSPEDVKMFETYYGISDQFFLSYLGSLGLRNYSGTDKQAFITLYLEVKKRGW